MSSYQYKAYNLNFASCIQFRQLEVSQDKQIDVTISRGKIAWNPSLKPEEFRSWHIDGDDVYYYWQLSGKYLIRGGKEIIFDPSPDAISEYAIGLPILGPVLGMLLHQRNYLVLHGSGIKIDGNACLFLGYKGQGKSTMAATLYGRGHKLMADDIAAITFDEKDGLMLLPGFPQIKLWPDAVTAALNSNPEDMPEIYPDVPKRACPTFENFHHTSIPLKRIYILGSGGEQPEIKLLKPQEALKQIVGNSYVPMNLGNDFSQIKNAHQHFYDCTKLVNQVSVCSLKRPRSLDLLPKIANLVEQDMAKDTCLTVAN